MKLNDRINIIVSEKDGVSNDALVMETYAGDSAGKVEKRARRLSSEGRYGKIYVGSISTNCLTEITTALDQNTLDNLNAYLDGVKCPHEAINHMLSIGWTQEQIYQYWPDSIKNSAGVRFKAKKPIEEIEITDAGLDRIADDIFDESFPFVREFNKFKRDVGWGEEKAKQHAKEVAQAEKVEKYKRDLLSSREARFYRRFRELGATHEQAVKYAWGE